MISQDPVDATGSLTKGLLSRRGILLMIEFSFKGWTAASGNTKPISLKQLCDWFWHRNKIVCVYVHVCLHVCVCVWKIHWSISKDILPHDSKNRIHKIPKLIQARSILSKNMWNEKQWPSQTKIIKWHQMTLLCSMVQNSGSTPN